MGGRGTRGAGETRPRRRKSRTLRRSALGSSGGQWICFVPSLVVYLERRRRCVTGGLAEKGSAVRIFVVEGRRLQVSILPPIGSQPTNELTIAESYPDATRHWDFFRLEETWRTWKLAADLDPGKTSNHPATK